VAVHTLSDHFASFFRRLNPGQSFESQASSHYNTIKGLIEDGSGSAAELSPICVLQGSYRNSTAIYTINDIDLVTLCRLWQSDSGGGTGGRSYNRDEIFRIIASPLLADRRYASKVRYGASSMCIKVDLGIKVEILPVVFKGGTAEQSAEPFRLYRRETNHWEDGYARYHQGYLSQKNSNGRAAGNFIPMIKVLKHCRSLIGATAVSFHLECLLYSLPDHLFLGAPADYIPSVFGYIASTTATEWYSRRVMTPCGERDIFVGTEWQLESWVQFHALIVRWASIALWASQTQNKQDAIKGWQALLGAEYFPASVA
jgi:hypothetical protein